MKYSTVAVTVAALVAGVVGQSIMDLPECPRNCIFSGSAKTECSLIDVACSCRDLSYQQQLAGCMAKCDPVDAAKGAEVGAAICKQAGVTISIPSITTTVSTPPTTEPVPSSTAPVVTTTDTPTSTPTPAPTTPVEDDEDDDEEEDDTISVPVPVVPTTVPTTTFVSVRPPVPTGNSTTNGTVTPPVTTPTPPPQEADSGAGRIAIGSMFGAAVLGAVAFAL